MPRAKVGLAAVPRGVWALGLVAMFMDISSELIHSLLPIFLVTSLGASTALVGLIQGIAEATAAITKVFSGWLSDRLGKRKLLTCHRLWARRDHQAGVSPCSYADGSARRAFS